MSYQVLARKWRPSTFEAMVGQDHVLQALVNALDSNRLHHAYLFTGTRGVGKTSIARLFAKALNCEQGVSSKPCGQCSPCREISEGRFVDLIEVDAASRTKVEDTRELMDNVQYAPTQGRYKVYLIDEVHMLSTHSFNALLKTLEEPPPHIKFLLATTDPQKLPVTILSRCLQFNLKNMVPEKIVEHLQQVLQAEQVPFEDNALWLLARAANGSMRDAMSLADQGIAFGSGQLLDADMQAMLGTVDRGKVVALLQQLAQGSAQGVLDTVAQMAQFGADSDAILADLLGLLHQVGIAQMLPDAVDNSQGDREATLALASQLRAEDVQLYYQIAVNGRRDLPHVPVAREGLEMTLLRMLAFRPVAAGELALPDGVLAGNEVADNEVVDNQVANSVMPGAVPATPLPADMPVSAGPAESVAQPVAVQTAPPARVEPSQPASAKAVPGYDDPPPWADADTGPGSDPGPDSSYGAAVPLMPEGGAGGAKKSEAPAAVKPEVKQVAIPALPVSAAEAEPPMPNVSAEAVGAQSGITPMGAAASSDESAIAPSETARSVVESPATDAAAVVTNTVATNTVVTNTVVTNAAVTNKANNEAAIDVTHGGELAVRWIRLIDRIGLTGMTYNIAANASLRSVEAGCWSFALSQQQIHLFNATHQQRLAQAMSDHLGEVVRVEVVEAPAQGETPAQYHERKRQERQALAVQVIESDPNVQAIIANYGARIDPASIQPIDNGELVK